MPLYEYECRECGHRVEVIQRFSDEPLTTCEECQGPLKKLLSAPAVQFKGTGWYVTDYARKGSGAAATAGGKESRSEGKSEGDGSKETSADSKSQSKSDSKSESGSKSDGKRSSTKGSDSGSGSSKAD